MKRCCHCQQKKKTTEFHRKGKGYQSICKSCRQKYHREHYMKNMDRYRKKNQEAKQKLKREVQKLKDVPCADCKRRFHFVCMDFDHRDGQQKEDDVSRLVASNKRKAALAEIAKCDVVCANCHRIRSFKRQ